jgi:hypothetical protein
MIRALALALALCGSTLKAQQPLVGGWRISFPAGMRMTNGSAETLMATGTLTIAARGDSLIGMLATDSGAGLASRPALRLAGTASGALARLVAHSKATINLNGNVQEATAVSTWTLRAIGDSLTGTVTRSIQGMEDMDQPAQPVTGRRRRR